MSILSITFHTIESQLANWNKFMKDELEKSIDSLPDLEKYILSEVESEMLTEGKNTNLLLVFENIQKRKEFTDTELPKLAEKIASKFGDTVMIFKTELNPLKSNF